MTTNERVLRTYFRNSLQRKIFDFVKIFGLVNSHFYLRMQLKNCSKTSGTEGPKGHQGPLER